MHVFDQRLNQATGVTCHSSEVQPGYIFVAIRGRSADGNTFAQAAANRGALAVVTDCPDNLPPLTIPVIPVPDARLALSELAAAFYRHPSHKLQLVGITGSNGKTTIACMLEHIFTCAGLATGLIGTIRVNTGKQSFPSQLTTPDAVSLHHYLAQMVTNKVTHAAMEVSAQGIDMHRTAHVRFSAGILSNICADHLDFHGSFAHYLAAKAKFLDLLAPGTPLIVNTADPYCTAIADRFTGRLVTAAVDAPADISAATAHLTPYGSAFNLQAGASFGSYAGQYTIALPLPGRHNIENALLAAAAALLHGLEPEIIAQALASFRGVERRMDIFHQAGITIMDDTALNPGSIEAVFAAAAGFRYQRLIIVNAIRGQRGPAINAANAAAIAGWQRKLPFELIITASSDQAGPADTVTTEERLAFVTALNALKTDYTYTNTLADAVKAALTVAAPGDLLILMGAQGMDNGRQILTTMVRREAGTYQQPAYAALAALASE